MVNTIKNTYLEISVKSFGATLTSVKSQKSGYEFLWQGNAEIWNGQSPVLFPVIGGLLENKCVIDGKEYEIIRHGIARHREFELFSKTDSELVFVQRENEETLKSYPFKYELYMSFKLDGNSLTVTHTVKNTNDGKMCFGIGAHPAFNCETGDRIIFEKPEKAYCERIGADSLLNGETDLILNNNDTITIKENTFDKDVMIFSSLNSKYVTLKKEKLGKEIKFSFYDAPFFSVWAKPNALFVCLEPWCGINDSHEKADSFFEKRANITLDAGDSFSFCWKAEFSEK